MKETIKKLINLPSSENGYVSSSINERKVKLNNMSRWHFKHKPYTCDCPPDHVRRG